MRGIAKPSAESGGGGAARSAAAAAHAGALAHDHARSLRETLEEALERHRGALVMLCSFQKEESVLLDELIRVGGERFPGQPIEALCRIVTIDTGVLFEETLSTWRRFEEHFRVRIDVEDASAPSIGLEGAWSGPENCCSVAKVAAIDRALVGAQGWITGVRREQSPTRADAMPIERDSARQIFKYNPLAHWSERDIWRRIHEHGLPYHPLHDRGYASIGCAPCTQPGSGREGRWAGLEKTECGLHLPARGAPAGEEQLRARMQRPAEGSGGVAER